MLPVINIGPLALPTPQLILLAGFWIGLELTEKQAERYGAQPGPLFNLTLAAIIAGLVGARLAYAAQTPAAFLESPLTLLAPRPQMLDLNGGLAAALIAGLVYIWVKKLNLWASLDALTTLFAVFGVTIGLAHFASGDAFGIPTQLPWGIELWGETRHPTQVYETLAATVIAAAVWPGAPLSRVSQQNPGSGFRFWAFLALSALARIALETFRGDSIIVMNLFRQAQLIAWVVLAISLWQMGRRLSLSGLSPQEAK